MITAGSQGATVFAPITTGGGMAVNATVAGNNVGLGGLIEPSANLSRRPS